MAAMAAVAVVNVFVALFVSPRARAALRAPAIRWWRGPGVHRRGLRHSWALAQVEVVLPRVTQRFHWLMTFCGSMPTAPHRWCWRSVKH